MDRPGLSAKIVTVGCIINIILNYLLIPSNSILSPLGIVGQNGAAVATVISVLITYVIFRIVSKKLVNVQLFNLSVLLHIFAALIMGIALCSLGMMIDPIRWYHLLSFSFIGLGIYLLVLWLIKEFRKDDYRMIMDTINPKEILHYVKSEMKGKHKEE